MKDVRQYELLAIPSPMSEESFQLRAETARALQCGQTSFTMATNEGFAQIHFRSHKGKVRRVGIRPPASIQADALAHLQREESDKGPVYFSELIPSDGQGYLWPMNRLAVAPSSMDPTGRKAFGFRSANAIDVSAAARLINAYRDADRAHEIMFYSGAGISCAGDAPMISYDELTARCGFRPLDIEPQDEVMRDTNSTFIADFLRDPACVRRVTNCYQELLDNTYADASTPAHVALAGIFRSLGERSSFVTTNYDLKHEAAGSRLKVLKIPTYWEWPQDAFRRESNPYWGTNRYAACETVQKAVRALIGRISLIVVVGASADRKGVLSHFCGPVDDECRILAINSQTPERIPYIGRDDLYVRGDAQTVLPQLQHELDCS